MSQPAVFLDRDGTINEQMGYINHLSRFRLLPQAVPAIRSGRVVPIPGDTVLRPGPRVGEGLARLAQAIHREPGERQEFR